MEGNRVAGVAVQVEEVESLPNDLEDEERLLKRTNLKRIVVENSSPTRLGMQRTLVASFPGEVAEVIDGVGRIRIVVCGAVEVARAAEIEAAARLVSACDFNGIEIVRQSTQQPATLTRGHSASTVKKLAHDRAQLEDYLTDSLEGRKVQFEDELPTGSSAFASPLDGVDSLLQRLALFERVYLAVPLRLEDFAPQTGASIEDVLAALPTGRIVPVLHQSPDRYERGVIDRVLDSGAPRVLLRGELFLRTTSAFVDEHPMLSYFLSDGEAMRPTRQILRSAADSEPRLQPALGYVEALADVSSRIGMTALNEHSVALGLQPLAEWLDSNLGAKLGLPSRDLELGAAIELRTMARAVEATAMSAKGHYLDGYLQLLAGTSPGNSELLSIPDPTIIGRVCFPDLTGLTLKKFAEEFRGPSVAAMRALVASPRVQGATGTKDLVAAFNTELRTYSRRADGELVATAILLGVAGLVGSLGVPAFLAGLSIELSRRLLGRKTPRLFAAITSRMTGATREAALLARIEKP